MTSIFNAWYDGCTKPLELGSKILYGKIYKNAYTF
jgi:hypothetical protein